MIVIPSNERQRRLTRCVFWAMRNRCYSPKSAQFANYGGRGIRVSDEWTTPESFIRDMGYKPNGMTIDRIDVNGDYTRENCRWASVKDQANNKRSNTRVTAWGMTFTAAEWSEFTGVPRQAIANRVTRLGWPHELAVIVPKGVHLRRAGVFQKPMKDLPAILAAAGLAMKKKR